MKNERLSYYMNEYSFMLDTEHDLDAVDHITVNDSPNLGFGTLYLAMIQDQTVYRF